MVKHDDTASVSFDAIVHQRESIDDWTQLGSGSYLRVLTTRPCAKMATILGPRVCFLNRAVRQPWCQLCHGAFAEIQGTNEGRRRPEMTNAQLTTVSKSSYP